MKKEYLNEIDNLMEIVFKKMSKLKVKCTVYLSVFEKISKLKVKYTVHPSNR